MDTEKQKPFLLTVATLATVALQKKLGLDLDPTAVATIGAGLLAYLAHHRGASKAAAQ